MEHFQINKKYNTSWVYSMSNKNCHLPSAPIRIRSLATAVLTFNSPGKEFRVDIRYEALRALGKTGRMGLQIVKYLEKISRVQIPESTPI